MRKNNDNKDVAVEHIISKAEIATVCNSNCPLKLYAKRDDKIIFGCGTIVTDTIMILPSYDVKVKADYNTLLTITRYVYNEITHKELLEDCYVTRTIKCFRKADYDIGKQSAKCCIGNLWYEIRRIKPKRLIIFDKLLYQLIESYMQSLNIIIKTNMSPGVMYYNNDALKRIFVDEFRRCLYE